MTSSNHAVFDEHDGRPALQFERVLSHSPERVWNALVKHEQMLDWHPTPFELEPRTGGRVHYLPAAEASAMPDGEGLAYEPPRLLAYTWGEDELRFELRPHDEGCVLRLTHSFDDRFKAARDAAGWHLCLQQLADSLDAVGRSQTEPRPPADWQSLNADYERRFGIAHEQATPPPPH